MHNAISIKSQLKKIEQCYNKPHWRITYTTYSIQINLKQKKNHFSINLNSQNLWDHSDSRFQRSLANYYHFIVFNSIAICKVLYLLQEKKLRQMALIIIIFFFFMLTSFYNIKLKSNMSWRIQNVKKTNYHFKKLFYFIKILNVLLYELHSGLYFLLCSLKKLLIAF